MFRQVDQPGVGPVLSPSIPLRFDEQRLPAQPAPRLGADTESVLTEVLGLSCAEVGRLHDQGVVRCA
ncbi:hypothetical protein D3C78_1374320 [compost metagenome]